MKEILPWKILDSRYLFRRKWMDVREDRVELPTGVIIDEFHVIEYPDWVCVLPITDDGSVVLVEQYRHGIGRLSTEFPAGVIDEGESILDAARRELLEETGYAARRWSELGSCTPEPSRHSNMAHFVLAGGAYRAARPAPDESENVRVRIETAGAIPGIIERKEMIHGVHLAAVMTAVLKGELSF